jgi:hypothetical protein
MSKPDPSITANLLDNLGAKPQSGNRDGVKPAQAALTERHPAPVGHKSTKPAPAKQATGRTRTSNRGK